MLWRLELAGVEGAEEPATLGHAAVEAAGQARVLWAALPAGLPGGAHVGVLAQAGMLRLFLVAARLQGLPPQLPARELPNCMALLPVALAADGCRYMHSSAAAWPASSN